MRINLPGAAGRLAERRAALAAFFSLPVFFLVFSVCDSSPAQSPFGLLVSEQLRSSFTLLGSGARAAGMGGAFTAVADDATAASFNPAGLAQLILPEASFVLDRISLQDRYRDFYSHDHPEPYPLSDSDTHFQRNDFNFFSLTVPFQMAQRNWAVQFSTQKVVDLAYGGERSFLETDPAGNPMSRLQQDGSQDGAIRVYSGTIAVEATQRLMLGLTVNRWDGDWKFQTTVSEEPIGAPDLREYLNYGQSSSLYGWNCDLGMLLRYKYANVGFRYRAGFQADFRFATYLDTNLDTPLTPLPGTATTMDWPGTLSLGLAIKPSDNLTITADYVRTDWSKMMFVLPGEGQRLNFFDLLPEGETRVAVSGDWHLGGEYLLFFKTAVIPLRAGWLYEPQPVADDATGERIISTGYAAGAGIKIDWFAMDFAYQRRTSSTQVSVFSEPDEIAVGKATSIGRLDRSEDRFFVSFIFQLPEGSPARKWIRTVFVKPSETE